MDPDIGRFIAPSIGLALQIIEVDGGSQRPEVLFDIANAPSFDLAFFMGSPNMTRLGDDVKGS